MGGAESRRISCYVSIHRGENRRVSCHVMSCHVVPACVPVGGQREVDGAEEEAEEAGERHGVEPREGQDVHPREGLPLCCGQRVGVRMHGWMVMLTVDGQMTWARGSSPLPPAGRGAFLFFIIVLPYPGGARRRR